VKRPTIAGIAARYRVTNGARFHLADISPADEWGASLKPSAGELLSDGIKRLSDLQERLDAQDRWSILLVFQAMDAAGKDGTIKHVMSSVNPQGCEVHPSRRLQARSWITTSRGAPRASCRGAGISASSTGRTTKRRSRQGVIIRKFFLHLSREEQRRRFLTRLKEADKHWKFSLGDVSERAHFTDYMHAYEDTIRHTSTAWAPWHVIPADRK